MLFKLLSVRISPNRNNIVSSFIATFEINSFLLDRFLLFRRFIIFFLFFYQLEICFRFIFIIFIFIDNYCKFSFVCSLIRNKIASLIIFQVFQYNLRLTTTKRALVFFFFPLYNALITGKCVTDYTHPSFLDLFKANWTEIDLILFFLFLLKILIFH